jgi:hypothetical protein
LKALKIMIAMRIITTAVLTLLTVLVASVPAADARHAHGRGGFGHHGLGLHGGRGARASAGGAGLAADPRHANDTYVNAASQEEDKLLDTKIKNICRGC